MKAELKSKKIEDTPGAFLGIWRYETSKAIASHVAYQRTDSTFSWHTHVHHEDLSTGSFYDASATGRCSTKEEAILAGKARMEKLLLAVE